MLGTETIPEAMNKTTFLGVGFLNKEKVEYTYFDIFFTVEWDLEHSGSINYFTIK